MSFRDNLLHLRAAHNMTQEQLAVQLGVSRQSVTKWESERSYPEMDKLIKLCQVFDCTLDELVQGDLTGRAATPTPAASAKGAPADVFGYDEFMRGFASRVSNGVMALILGITVSIALFSLGDPTQGPLPLLPENLSVVLGLLCVFGGIGVGLALLIPAGLAHSQFVRAHPFIEDFYTAEQKARARTVFAYELIGGIMGVLLGVCAVILFADGPYETLVGVPLMLCCIAVGVRFIIHGSMTLSRVNIAQYNRTVGEVLDAAEIESAPIPADQKREALRAHRADRRIGAVCGTIMIVATIIGLLLLFAPLASGEADYHSGTFALFWLPWPIGGLLCGIAALLIKGFDDSPDAR